MESMIYDLIKNAFKEGCDCENKKCNDNSKKYNECKDDKKCNDNNENKKCNDKKYKKKEECFCDKCKFERKRNEKEKRIFNQISNIIYFFLEFLIQIFKNLPITYIKKIIEIIASLLIENFNMEELNNSKDSFVKFLIKIQKEYKE